MTCTLVLPHWLAEDIEKAAQDPLETAGVLLASMCNLADGTRKLLARRIHWVPPEAYRHRSGNALLIGSDGYVPALQEAETIGACAIWFHTHPSHIGIPLPSSHDDRVDEQLSDLFRLRTGAEVYGSLIVSPGRGGFTFSGFIEGDRWRAEIDRLIVVGDRLRFAKTFRAGCDEVSPEFDRSVRAFGGAVQASLGELRFGIVGNGGTGSAVTEQLVRLGARKLALFDPDTLTTSNLTRVYGSRRTDVGRPKPEILRDHLLAIAPDLSCETHNQSILEEAVARQLASCDVVFGCTDDNAGRLVLSRLASYFLIPVFDCGVLLSSDASGQLTGIDGRVTTLCPGTSCLVCRDRVDLRRAAAEQMSAAEHGRLAAEGYAPSLGRVEPAVVTFTTMVAAAAVSELIERLVGYGPTPRPSEVLLRAHDRETSTNIVPPRDGHYCDPAAGKLGTGTLEPFLEQAWR
ncbi:Molybdopterin or thiamine biosynthesis adenylyltransferase [Variovorax sp. YR750]|uniref:HesA/MoeB/ThiF family protein n=1 Tax=Variovorax sp. YR750 TaxID=1884384 RepID=UPI0008B7133A|nr:ThiF family adenylyltransferase [Variovorax sp. YR750]SEM15085.1 Molybdopterin or thiamine biosynthesis adenylyltransferase [Variovorax sp. YR750]